MTFKNFVCWSSAKVHQVMNVEATQPLDHIFLATHYPVAMYRQELIQAESRVEYDEEKFLKDFLATEDFLFVPVLGESGTGKSHLIRWLAANIKSTAKRRVLLIPKVGTNLKDIIDKILQLEGLKEGNFQEYRQRLNKATNTLTESQARVQLLNQLAAVVGRAGNHNLEQLSEVQEYLVEELESLLYDPFFREHWLKPGGIIDSLVIHTLGNQDTVKIIEERQEFSIDDLPLNVLDLQKAGEKAKDFYALLIGDDNIQKATVEWLNQHLDQAIIQVLNLGREDLQRLMREVRETLAEQGIELVLLIEDFAKLQGIDREVLEAVLARPQQPGRKPLCAMRTALACTTGYFTSNVLETVRQRINFSVNLNIGTVGAQSLVTQADIQKFVARYLNAVRLEDQAILNWANELKEEDSQRGSLASACDQCEHRQACHEGFREVDGMGLYPFTPKALEQMLGKVNAKEFNPRILIKDVLKYTLENAQADIKQGRFPNLSLREHFGKLRLSAIVQDDIKAKDKQNFLRRQILLDLWTDSNGLCNLAPEIHTAFDIPLLDKVAIEKPQIATASRNKNDLSLTSGLQESSSEYQFEPKPSGETAQLAVAIPDKLAEKLKLLDNWNNQEILDQDIAKELREFIYPAVIEAIEWNTEMLIKGSFVGSGQIFKQRNLTFHSPRVTRETIAGIKLSLPLNPDDSHEFLETAIAFQGILQYSYYKHWKFPDGDRCFRAYAKQLKRWSGYILEEIRRFPRLSAEVWNPVPAAVEILAIAATMAGHSTSSLEDLVNALFLDLDNKAEVSRGKSWKELFNYLKRYREPILEIVRSQIACTKGSSKSFQIIDAVQIIEPLKKISKDWQPKSEVPDDLRNEFNVIKKVRQQIDELLEKALIEERDYHLNIYQALVAELGENLNKKEMFEIIQQAKSSAQEAGVFGERKAENLNAVLDKFNRTRLNGYLNTMKRVQTDSVNTGKLLPHLSEDHQNVMQYALEFLDTTKSFLDSSLNRAQTDLEDLLSAEGGTVESSHQEIIAGLEQLHNLLTEIKGDAT